ncbi:MAG TPA: glucoamylase family protein [Candidatus Acidoferrum sp.]|nr:glucoamylase family protein [Candidatus Acidoferrum sp.]
MHNQKKHLGASSLSRRELLLRAGGIGLWSLIGRPNLFSLVDFQDDKVAPHITPGTTALSKEDDQFLDELEKLNLQYFWEQASPQTGLVKDRCNVQANSPSTVGSIAATGFGLTALCIGEKRGFIPPNDVRERVLTTLRFLWKKMPTHRGFFYHFADINTGERVWDSEVSSVDTSILLCGILTCRQHFEEHSEISLLAYEIFNRVDWSWLSEDTSLLPHGWTPELGFLPYRWDYYSEMMMIYLLGLGSLPHPLPIQAWTAWKRTKFEFDGFRYIGSFAPLFIHQYSQAWFDFRGKRDAFADYFENSTLATDAHRRFCLELGKQFPDYSDDLWGITASDSEKGYVIWGGPPMMGPIDGTVVPSASAGSLPFLPQSVLRVLRNIKDHYARAWCRYGFVNAFNPLKNWYDTDVVGIDTGITMLMAENLRSNFVWDTFMKNMEAKRGMDRAGFKKYEPSITNKT